jgi:glycosyltransferase involved in cell wall biosynthesis
MKIKDHKDGFLTISFMLRKVLYFMYFVRNFFLKETMTDQNRSTISAFIVCMNEETQIRRCLESVKWCDEIVVIDSGSTDKTLEICKEYDCKIYQRDWPGYVLQKTFGLEKCSSEWVLNLDADEEVSKELQEEIQKVLGKDAKTVNGYLISRIVFFLNIWWRKGGWYPEYRLRLCRKAYTKWGGLDPHEKATVSGKTVKLKGELYHYTYTDITDQTKTLNSYSFQSAKSLHSVGKHFSLLKLIFNPFLRFLKSYIFKKGFLEGIPGFIVAYQDAYYVFLKYAKMWEIERNNQQKEK